MEFEPRQPEQPKWALMFNPDTVRIVSVRESDCENKLSCGWLIVARESELLPFNPPRLIPDDEPLPVRRPRAHKRQKQDGDGDGA